jgi:peptide/nickel transport system permease protein
MDILSRVLYAPRVDLVIAVTASLAALMIGGSLGIVAGYNGGRLSEIIGRASDIIQSFPAFVLALVLVAATGQRIENVIYVIAFVTAPLYARLLKAQTLTLRERAFVEAARCMGVPRWRILVRHIVPNAMGPAFAQFSVSVGGAILFTAGLSFLGAGVRIPTPEWGVMIATGAKNMITGEWWTVVFPSIAMALTVMGFALTADGIRDWLEPR